MHTPSFTPQIRPGLRLGALALATILPVCLHGQSTGFIQTGAGPFDYNDAGNWVGTSVNGIWDSTLSLSANQNVTFGADTTLTTRLDIGYAGTRDLTFTSGGVADRNLTLGGDITINPLNDQEITFGSTSANHGLNINLGGDRTLTVAGNKTVRFENTISGGNLVITSDSDSVGGSVALGNSSAAAASNLTVTREASLTFDGSASGNTGATRAQSINLAGGSLNLSGNAGANNTEAISGALTLSVGRHNNIVTLTPDAASHTRLTGDSVARGANSSAFFRGTDLGVNSIASQTAGSSNISFSTAPTLVGGLLGTKTAGILPWAIVDTSATGLGTSFATYDATNGIRALDASEYSTTIATDSSTDGHNIKLTATGTTLTADGATTINSLFVDSSGVNPGIVLAGTGSLTVTSGAIFFDIASATNHLVISKNINFGSTQGILGTTGSSNQRRISFSGGISGTGGLVFYDTGTNTGQAAGFYLAHANTYTGDTYINGHVTAGANNALPNFSNNGRTGDIYLSGQLKLSAKNTAIQINGLWGNGTVYSEYTNSNKTLVVGDNNATSTFDGHFSAGGGSVNLAKIGTGVLTLTGTDSAYAGYTAVRNGTLSAVTLNSVTGGTATSSLGAPTLVDNGTIALGLSSTTGTLRVTGTGETTDRVINLAGTTGGGGIEQAGSGLLKFTSDLTATGNGLKTLTLSGSTTGTGEIAGAIVDSAAATSLTKNGTGTWVLSGLNTHSGNTTVNDGVLALGANNAFSTSSAIVLAGGTVDLRSFSASATSLDFSAGSTMAFELGTAGSSTALLALTGDFNQTGSGAFNLDFSGSGEVGTYKLLSFSGTSFSDTNEFNIANLGSGLSGSLALDGSSLSLIVTSSAIPEPASFALLGGLGALAFVSLRRKRCLA